MPVAQSRVVLYGRNSSFFEFAAFHLATAGIQTVAVASQDLLLASLAEAAPVAALLHWDTLGNEALGDCRRLKEQLGPEVPVLMITEQLGSGLDVVEAFASGVDGLIEGAANPRLFLTKFKSYLRRLTAF